GGRRAMSGNPGTVQRYERSREPRPGRLPSGRQRARRPARLALRSVSDTEIAPEPDREDAVRRGAANARDRPRTDDAAQAADSRRTDTRSCTCDPGAVVEGARSAAEVDVHYRAARRAERHVRGAARGPRVCAGTRAHHLGGKSVALRARDGTWLPGGGAVRRAACFKRAGVGC